MEHTTCGYLEDASRRALLRRLARIQGHVGAIANMVEERACADDILLQVTAVKGALNRFASILVEEELKDCVDCAGPTGDRDERVDRLTRVIATMLKQT